MAALSAYGRELGEAFALRDDLLGVWGNPTVTGKASRRRPDLGKADSDLGALSRAAYRSSPRRRGNASARREFSSADVELLQDELRACGVVDKVESMISSHVHAAVDALDPQLLDSRGIAGLTQLAHRIAWRDR